MTTSKPAGSGAEPTDAGVDVLSGGGEAGALMRAVDWSRSPLGPPDTWPQSLRSVVGLLLHSKFPMFVAWGPELVFLYNDPYAAVLGAKHPSAMGRRFHDIWAEIWPDISPLVDSALAGEATYRQDFPLLMNRRGFDEQTWFTFSYSPVFDERGEAAGMFCACTETTSQVLSQRRQRFQIALETALAGRTDPREVMDTAVRVLGEHLGADRVGYSEVHADGATITLASCYANGVQRLTGTARLDDFGAQSVDRQRGGVTEVVGDVRADPGQVHRTWDAIDTRALVSVPLIRDGELRASLYVNFREPRRWSDLEVADIEMVAARTWDAVERARVQTELRDSEARFRLMADHAPVMLWVTDAGGVCTYLNRAWYAFTGQSPGEAEGYGWLDATHPDDREMAERTFREANAARAPFRLDYRLRRADGVYRWCIDAAAPRLGPSGEYFGYIGSVIDIDERRDAESRQRDSEARLRTITNTLPAFVWFATPDGELHYFNDRWYDYTGQTPETALPLGWADVLHPDDAQRVQSEWQAARAAGVSYENECRYRRKDGAYRWYVARAEPLKNPDGQITGWVGSSSDIHDRVIAEDQHKLLINELNHRVKNTLSTVQSLATQSAAQGRSTAEYRAMFEGRLLSLSAAHDLLTATNWEGVSLSDLVARAIDPWGASHRFVRRGPPVWLSPRQALSISLALHELATNATKYGALSTPVGQVEIAWDVAGDELRLHWQERDGPPVQPPQRRGFGSRLLERSIGRELMARAQLAFHPAGVEYTLRLPMTEDAGPE